jgi:putative sterol carrier protein
MATIEQCEQALRQLAEQLAGVDSATRKKVALDRTISCRLRDLGVIFAGELRDGNLQNIRQVDRDDGQLRLTMDSDDLLKLASGELNFLRAWASGKIRVDASVFDLLKLRSIF